MNDCDYAPSEISSSSAEEDFPVAHEIQSERLNKGSKHESSVHTDQQVASIGEINYSNNDEIVVNIPESQSAINKNKRIDKKQRMSDGWKPSVQKKKREKGREYLGRKKENDEKWNYEIKKKERKIKNRCLCKDSAKNKQLKCSLITERERLTIFTKFWAMSWPEKKVYIEMMVDLKETKRKRGRKNEEISRRSKTVNYYLRVENERHRVCKKMFLGTLAIGEWFVMNCKKKANRERQRE